MVAASAPVLPVDEEEFSIETRVVSPLHFLLKIESFSLLSEKGFLELESKEFDAQGYKWRFFIQSGTEHEAEHISAFLTMADTSSLPVGWEVNAMFSFFLFNQISDNYLCFRGKVRRFNGMKCVWGLFNLISLENLKEPSNGFLVGDICVFGVEVFVIQNQRTTECVSLSRDMLPVKEDEPQKKHHSWLVTNFSKLGELCKSEVFEAHAFKWVVCLFPKGSGPAKGKSVSLYLQLVSNNSSVIIVEANVSFCIKNPVNGHCRSKQSPNCLFTPQAMEGINYFVPIAEMSCSPKGFVVSDCFIVETVVTVRDTQ